MSRWLRENVLVDDKIAELANDLGSFLLFSAWCRWVNWPPTIKAAMDKGFYPSDKMNWTGLGRFLDQRGKTEKVFTGAYLIRASAKKGERKGSFISRTVVGKHLARLLPELTEKLSVPGQLSYKDACSLLRGAPNFGTFMSGQIAGDWTYTALLGAAPDLKTWAPMGPGSVRGFNRITGGEKLTKRPPEELWLEKLGEWRRAIVKELGPRKYGDLTALDVQNCLCEVDKWLRVQSGQGRPRAKYAPHEY